MIPRFGRIVTVALIIALAFGLYRVKYQVQAIQSEIASVSRQLEAERESLNVAAAEWAYLNRPERLQALAVKHLKLQPASGRQMADVEAIPMPNQRFAADGNPIVPASVHPAEGE